MDRRKNVNASGEACVANLMKIALVPKANDAAVREYKPFDKSNLPHANDYSKLQFYCGEYWLFRRRLVENSYLEIREVRQRVGQMTTF